MSLARRTKDTLRRRLSPSLKLSLKRLFVGTVAAGLRVGARAVNLFDRVLMSATMHGLDFHQAWDIKRVRPKAPHVQPWGAADFLFLLDASKGRGDGVPAPDRPVRTSIVLLAYNKIEYTFQCLRSVFQEVDLAETEIIVVDNGSRDETARVLSYLEGFIRVITIEQNAGFLDACNIGARAARGRYLILLNNDIVLLPGWLAPLLATVEADEKVGAVGSMYIYPNGILQNAGSIVWNDGESIHYGWGRSPEDKRFNFAREVDYCPGASFLIRKELFDRLGGLDRRYAPAYYEDVDLCFGVRALGYKVVYQPLSRVIHHEGITLGTDVNIGFKRFQVINREKFYEKWRELLEREHYEAAPENVLRASDRGRGPALLVCDARVPTPDRDAGSARMSFILKSLVRWSRPVFVSMSKPKWPEYEKPLWQAGIETANVVELQRLLKERQFSVALISRPEVAEVVLPLLRRYAPRTKIIYDMVDVHFLRYEREAELTGDAEIARDAAHYRDLETRIARTSNFIFCTSTDEKEIMERAAPGVPVAIVPTMHELHERGGSFDERQHLLFIGNFAHRPNLDGVLYFLREVYPLIKQALPCVELDIIGDNPGEILSHADEAVRVRGYVPDVEPFWQTRRVFIAPLRYGAGVKGKIGEALAHGLPVVTTPVGAEGMGLAHEESAMITATPAAFAEAVVGLYTRPDLWQRLADRGYEHIARHFTPASITPVIEDSMRELSAARSK